MFSGSGTKLLFFPRALSPSLGWEGPGWDGAGWDGAGCEGTGWVDSIGSAWVESVGSAWLSSSSPSMDSGAWAWVAVASFPAVLDGILTMWSRRNPKLAMMKMSLSVRGLAGWPDFPLVILPSLVLTDLNQIFRPTTSTPSFSACPCHMAVFFTASRYSRAPLLYRKELSRSHSATEISCSSVRCVSEVFFFFWEKVGTASSISRLGAWDGVGEAGTASTSEGGGDGEAGTGSISASTCIICFWAARATFGRTDFLVRVSVETTIFFFAGMIKLLSFSV